MKYKKKILIYYELGIFINKNQSINLYREPLSQRDIPAKT